MPAMPVQGIGGERTILAMFKDAGLVALVSLALAVTYGVAHTIDRGAGGGLTIELRIAECAIRSDSCLFGRLGLSLAHTRAVRLVLAVSAFIAGYLFLGVMGYALPGARASAQLAVCDGRRCGCRTRGGRLAAANHRSDRWHRGGWRMVAASRTSDLDCGYRFGYGFAADAIRRSPFPRSRDPRDDLHYARLGLEHRGRPRGIA